MEDPKELFLEAEAQADKLISQLTMLKEKMEGHAEAEKSLEEVRDALVATINEISDSSNAVRAVVNTLGEIGTPEILEALNKLQITTQRGVEYIRDGITETQARITDDQRKISEETETKLARLERYVWGALGASGISIILLIVLLIRS